jgi:hypothetical protein
VLARYMQDPRRGRRALLRLGRRERGGLPPPLLLALADARLRQGRHAAARALFEEVAYGTATGPWDDWAALGLGWIAVLEDDTATARRHFARVAEGGSPSRPIATLLLVMLDAEGGTRASQEATLEALADDPDAAPGIRQVAALALGYLAYWDGDYELAAAAFDHAALVMAGSRLWDDARYGAAVARWHAGDETRALAELRALAHVMSPVAARERATDALLDLERRAIVESAIARSRRQPLRVPEEQVTALLDRDGPALARARLAALGEIVPAPAIGRDARPIRSAAPARTEIAPAPPGDAPATHGADPRPARLPVPVLLVVAVLGGGLLVPAAIRAVRGRRARRRAP